MSIRTLAGGSYGAVLNAVGGVAKLNQNVATQPPTVIINAKPSLACYLKMPQEDRKTGCKVGDDVFIEPEGRTKVGKYGGFVTVHYRQGSAGNSTYGSFQHDFVVDSSDISGVYGCSTVRYEPVPAQGGQDLLSTMSLQGYNPPVNGVWVYGNEYGIAMTSDFMYNYVTTNYRCGASSRKNAAIINCDSKGKGWYMPSINELNALYQNRDILGGFSNERYWTAQSTANDMMSYVFDFSTGTYTYTYRTELYKVRCLRVFDERIKNS